MNIIHIKQYIKSFLTYIMIIIILTSIFYFLFQLEDNNYYELKTKGPAVVCKILLRNTQNFAQYIFLAPIMPLFYIMDCVSTSWSLSASLQINGLQITLRNLFPHGIVKIPNFCLYTLISYKICQYFYSSQNINFLNYINQLCQHKITLLICEVLIIFSAILEGSTL